MTCSITRTFEFSAGHTLADHPGKCRLLHGHNYRLEVTIEGRLNSQGMVMDFGDLKTEVMTILDPIDHHFLIWNEDPRRVALLSADPSSIILVSWPPTVEHLAQWIQGLLEDELGRDVSIILWETEDAYASV